MHCFLNPYILFEKSMNEPTVERRVKLYTLSEEKWIDCGTGYCSGHFVPNPHFKVIDESEPDKILLDSPIVGNTQYQRQQDTLIVWTNNDGVDYALSFQEPEGCLELCAFLINIQEKFEISSKISLIAIIQTANGEATEFIAGPIPELPQPSDDVNVLNMILDLLTIKEYKGKIIIKILENNGEWLIELGKLFHVLEKNKSLNMLYLLNDIVKSLVYYNEVDIWDLFVQNDEIFSNILGILEYDPEFQGFKMNWRASWLETCENSMQILKCTGLNEVGKEAEAGFGNDFFKYLSFTFLKNTVLIKILDDSNVNCLVTLINNVEMKIVEYIQDHHEILDAIFQRNEVKSNKDSEKNDEINEDVDKENKGKSKEEEYNLGILKNIKLLHQFIVISKNLQNLQRTSFYTLLISKGLIELIEFSLKNTNYSTELKVRLLVTELIIIIVEHDILLFKDFNQNLLNILITIFLKDEDIVLKSQSFEALKILIDPNNLNDNETNTDTDEMDDLFFVTFYENSAMKLFSPLITLFNGSEFKKLDWNQSFVLENIINLLEFVSKSHNPIYSRSFILENHLVKCINRIILNEGNRFKCKLQLNSIKCLRSIILLDDGFYTHYLIENDTLKGIFELLNYYQHRDNMLTSYCYNVIQIIYENMSSQNYKLLAEYVRDNYKSTLEDCDVGKMLLENTSNEENSNNDSDLDDDTVVISYNAASVEETVKKRGIDDLVDHSSSSLTSEPKKRAT